MRSRGCSKIPNLHDDPILPGKNAFGDPNIQHKYTDDLPEVHDVLREIRALVDTYPGDPVLISEADEPTIQDLVKMYGPNNDEIQLPMDFKVADLNRLSAPDFRRLLDEVEFNLPTASRISFSIITIRRAPGTATAMASTTIRLRNSWPRCC